MGACRSEPTNFMGLFLAHPVGVASPGDDETRSGDANAALFGAGAPSKQASLFI